MIKRGIVEMKYKRAVLGLGIFFTFLSGFIAAEVVCYHIPIVRMVVPVFMFTVVASLAIGIMLIIASTKVRYC